MVGSASRDHRADQRKEVSGDGTLGQSCDAPEGGAGEGRSFNVDTNTFVEGRMTVVAMLKQQYRHIVDYLTAVCGAALCGEIEPSLLPIPADIEQLMRPAA